jgi:hypothetical protein
MWLRRVGYFHLLRSWLSWLSEISRIERWRMNRTFFCRARDTRLRMSELAEEIASTTTGLGTLIHKIFYFFPRNNFGCAFSKTLLLTASDILSVCFFPLLCLGCKIFVISFGTQYLSWMQVNFLVLFYPYIHAADQTNILHFFSREFFCYFTWICQANWLFKIPMVPSPPPPPSQE